MYMYVPAPMPTADVRRVIGTGPPGAPASRLIPPRLMFPAAAACAFPARTKTTRKSAQSLAIPTFSSICFNYGNGLSPWHLEIYRSICQSN